MASLLEIHFADIRVVSIYQGSTVVEFEVTRGELDNDEDEDDEGFFARIGSKFESVVEEIVDFMDTPVLNAVKDGKPVKTVNSEN